MEITNKNLVIKTSNNFSSKNEVFELFAKKIVEENDSLKLEEVVEALQKRESEGTTGLGDGIAVPHASIKIEEPKIVVLRLSNPMDWKSIDKKKVDLAVCIFVPNSEDGRKEHFRLLTNFSISMLNEDFKKVLRNDSPTKVVELIQGVNSLKEKENVEKKKGVLNIVAVTSCAVGIAHTYMAAEAIELGAKARGYNVKVEKRGGMGIEDKLTPQEIVEADVCIIASEVEIDKSIFEGKRLYVSEASEAIKLNDKYIDKAVKQAMIYKSKNDLKANFEETSEINAISGKTGWWPRAQKHLLFGISWMLPLVVVSGIMLGVTNIITTIAYEPGGDWAYWDNNIFMQPMIEFGQIGFALMYPVFSAAVSYSIASKPAAAPGLIAGWMITSSTLIMTGFNWEFLQPIVDAGITGGFFGAIFTGMFVGWAVNKISKIKVHKYAAPLMPILIVPLFLSFFMFIIIKFVIGLPLAMIMYGVYWILEQMATAGPAIIWIVGGLFGALTMTDLGGPINKTAFAVSMGLFFTTTGTTDIWQPYVAFEIAIPVASIGALFATFIAPKLFDDRFKVNAQTAAAMGCFGISEGAIPITISNPKVWMPANIIGGFVAGSLAVLAGIICYGGVAGPFLMFLGSVGNAYGAAWLSILLWPIITLLASLVTALLAVLLLKMEINKTKKLAVQTKDYTEENTTSNNNINFEIINENKKVKIFSIKRYQNQNIVMI